MVFPQQIAAALEIIAAYDKHTYAILLAQMQSGKTGTFMLVMSEMIRLKKVDYGVIFSGNREIELKEQTKNQDDFFESYADYLNDIGIMDLTIIDIIKTRFSVVWGPDLKHFSQKGNTIYIWEESHYGQSQKQQVDTFTTRLGIHPSGAAPDGCFVLSVSATPFSEYADFHELEQDKAVIRLLPPDQYLSVKKMIANKQLHAYTNAPKTKLEECLETHRALGYALVRGMASELTPIVSQHGWDVIHYDQSTSRGININVLLSTPPLRPTVIFLKGMIRMGKQVKKQFVLFCLETSKTTKTDTVLQGLLGRCCGYDSSPSIQIYIRGNSAVKKSPVMVKVNGALQQKKSLIADKLVPMWCYEKIDLVIEDIKRFIALHEGVASTPFRGANMTGNGSRERMIPIKVTFSPAEWKTIKSDTDEYLLKNDDKPVKGKKELRLNLEKLREILKTTARFENKNHPETQAEITRILSLATPLKPHYIGVDTKPLPLHGNKTAIEVLKNAFKGKGTRLKNLGPGLGVVENELVIFPDIDEKCVYIIFTMPSTIGETTGREVFSKKIPDNIYTVNGELGVKIPATIAIDADVFISVISECVQLSRGANYLIVPNFISPLKLGIFLTNDIFAKIQPGGEIYQALLKLGIVLHYKRAPGPRGTSGVRLSRISWTITDDIEHIPVATPLGTPLDETPDYESLDCSTYTKYDETFHDDVPMIISVFSEECDLDECDDNE
jgi:hypothetical protein